MNQLFSPIEAAFRWQIASLLLLFFAGIASAQTVATPVLSQPSGSNAVQFNVTVTDSTSGSTIYYTLDGTTPTTSSSTVVSGGTILISQSETLKAYAVESGMTDSVVASATYQLTGAVSVGMGYNFAAYELALRSDGTVWAWGDNYYGELGIGSTPAFTSTPVQVSGLSGVIAVCAGQTGNSMALKSDGTVWCWGDNLTHEIGDGTTTQRNTPVQVPGLTGIISISVGTAVKSDGTVWNWGANYNGPHPSPYQVSGLSNVVAAATNGSSYIALKSNGTVWTVGMNTYGELGVGNTTGSGTPIQVTSLSGITAIATNVGPDGYGPLGPFCLALKSDGTVWAWGNNGVDELGDGTTTQRNSPVQVSGLTGIEAINAAWGYGQALKNDGTLWAWGNNYMGIVGDGSLDNRPTPVQVTGLTGVMNIGLSQQSSAVNNVGAVFTWSIDTAEASYTSVLTPVQISGLTGIISVAAGGSPHTLAVKNDGTLWAWGDNDYGQLGDGTMTAHNSPEQIAGVTGMVAVACGLDQSVGLKTNGTVWAWGYNAYGQVGDGTTTTRTSPVQISGLSSITSVAAGSYHTMAIKSGGTVWTWGRNTYGALGDGTTTTRTSPVQAGSVTGIVALAGGTYHSVALKSDGTVWAWGWNNNYQLGDGTNTNRTSPIQVSSMSGVVAIAAGGSSTMALKSDGTVWTWGGANHTPAQVTSLSGIVSIAVGSGDFFALKNDGTTWAWGSNTNGVLGDGTTTTRATPVQISGMTGVLSVVANNYTVALKSDGTLAAWGDNMYGELGIGPSYFNLAPSPLLGFNLLFGSPTLSITSPASPVTGAIGQALNFTVSSSDSCGTVTEVDYYNQGNIIGTSTTSPFSWTWTPTTWGTFNITAVATDSNGATSTRTAAVVVTVPYDSDSNGLPDWWEMAYFGHLGNSSSSSPNGNGYTLAQDYAGGADPTNYFSIPNATTRVPTLITPVLTIMSGNNQVGTPSAFTDDPLVVKVTNSSGGAVLPNAPLTFTVTSGDGVVGYPSGALSSTLTFYTDSSGEALAFYQHPNAYNTVSTIDASSGGQSTTFTESTSLGDGAFDGPTDFQVNGVTGDEYDLSWVNHASTATGITIEQSADHGTTWTTIANLTDPNATSYVVTSCSPSTVYSFRVAGTK